MKISLNWLKDYVTTGISPEKLAHKLTMAGLEVEKSMSIKGDTILELEITPNRPDCLNMMGLARETAAILNKTYKFPKVKNRAWPKKKCDISVSDKKGCSRYIGTLVEDVQIKKAPEKITKRLNALGIRSINNVVDITNFCLMETGQPLHVFDYDKLNGGAIIVRRAREGETIVTIDDIERKLDPSILVIADAKRAVAIAGIMGGKGSEVTNKTKNILLESAYFDPVLIRRASRKLGLSSDSAYRFERGVDRAMVEGGANRAIDLILESAQGHVTQRLDVTSPTKKSSKPQITISKDQINARIGTLLTAAQCKNIFTKLDFKITGGKTGSFKITPPPFRSDIKEAVDIIEEVARIIGYDNIPLSFPQIQNAQILSDPKRNARRHMSGLLLAQGFNEIITYTMINRKALQQSNQKDLQVVAILNPLTQDQEIMRPSMLPGFLSVVRSNMNRGQKNIKFFEAGKIYTAKGERDVLGVIMTGVGPEDWRQTEKRNVDYYDLKGAVEQTFGRCGIKNDKIHFKSIQEPWFSPGQSSAIFINGKQAGTVGKIEENILAQWGIKQEGVFFGQIDTESIYHQKTAARKYKPVCEFPVINRDISLSVNTNVTVYDIEESIRKTAHSQGHVALADVRFTELYEGSKISKGQRGLIFSLTYQSRLAKTLRDEEVEQVHKKVCTTLVQDFGAVQR